MKYFIALLLFGMYEIQAAEIAKQIYCEKSTKELAEKISYVYGLRLLNMDDSRIVLDNKIDEWVFYAFFQVAMQRNVISEVEAEAFINLGIKDAIGLYNQAQKIYQQKNADLIRDIDLLIKQGADVNVCYSDDAFDNINILKMAISTKNYELIEYLLKTGKLDLSNKDEILSLAKFITAYCDIDSKMAYLLESINISLLNKNQLEEIRTEILLNMDLALSRDIPILQETIRLRLALKILDQFICQKSEELD